MFPHTPSWGMNLEELEFLDGDQMMKNYISCMNCQLDEVIYVKNDKIYWKRYEKILDVQFEIMTLAYGGTQHAGRKLYESSIILGK